MPRTNLGRKDAHPRGINADWHRAHPMPARPTLAERMAWHREHAQACACRPIPEKIKAEMAIRPKS
ncbi:MAG: hypothetical protein FJY82_09075 [Candidatus Aminicenantes bacterium]|nr:hypothetical protein [Candidatus Aminicenantes bacterium]